jgi:hypothetical protein
VLGGEARRGYVAGIKLVSLHGVSHFPVLYVTLTGRWSRSVFLFQLFLEFSEKSLEQKPADSPQLPTTAVVQPG